MHNQDQETAFKRELSADEHRQPPIKNYPQAGYEKLPRLLGNEVALRYLIGARSLDACRFQRRR
jgi:hypothetical protein